MTDWSRYAECGKPGCRALAGYPCIYGPRSYLRGKVLARPHPGRPRRAVST